MSAKNTLVVLPAIPAVRSEDKVVMTKKFIEGMEKYAEYWPGPVLAIMEPDPDVGDSLDNIAVDPDQLPFGVKVMSYKSPDLKPFLAEAALVQSGPIYSQNHIPYWCRELGVPCLFVTEYTLKTRLQIIHAEGQNRLIRWRQSFWEWGQERRNCKAVKIVAGVQCNGTPTYEAYKDLSPNPMLFFDSRTTTDQLAGEAEMVARRERLESGKPLTLAFTGRLNRMKGADHVISVARWLKKKKMDFKMYLCGDGELAQGMRHEIERTSLGDQVIMKGILDFRTELLPMMRNEVDLFVCCHRQGDPSCTYLETMACGIPVAGYENEAFAGIIADHPVGWGVPLERFDQLAARIMELDKNREEIIRYSENALDFARDHCFEETFRKRIDHMRSISSLTKDATTLPAG